MKFSKKIVFVIVAFLSFSDFCFVYAEKISHPKYLYKGIIGEAVGEGYAGMYAVACVYRNRLRKGMPLGCVAFKRGDLDRFVEKQGKSIKKWWQLSLGKFLVKIALIAPTELPITKTSERSDFRIGQKT